MDIQVLGAGAFGLSAALALAEDGHDVAVVEARQPGAGATGKAAGLVSTMAQHDDDVALIQATRGRLGELISLFGHAAGLGPVWKPFDSLLIADDAVRMDAIQDRLERATEEPERLDAMAAAGAFPALQFKQGEEVLVAQEDGAVDTGDLVALLMHAASEEGVELRRDEGSADATVVAAGPWTRKVLQARGLDLPLQAFRTQLASVQWPRDIPMFHDTVHGFYARPESDASILAGDGTILSPHDPDAFDEAGDPEFIHSIASRLVQRVKGAGDAGIRRAWAGLCVATPDTRPVCGKVPGADDVFVLGGDNGFGVMRCLALGQRLADAVDGDEAAATSPARFEGVRDDFPMREGFSW